MTGNYSRRGISLRGAITLLLAAILVIGGYSIIYQQKSARYINAVACTHIDGNTLLSTNHGTFAMDAPDQEPGKPLIVGQPYTFEVRGGGIGEYLPTDTFDPRIIRVVGFVGDNKLSDAQLKENLLARC